MPLTRLARRYHQNPANHIKIISQIEEEMSDVVLTQSGKFLFIFYFFNNESLLLRYEIAFIHF